MDDRTADEKNPNSIKYIPKSRYSPISFFISNSQKFRPEYNDLDFPVNKEMIDYVKELQGKYDLDLDPQMLNHIGFLYMRDLMCIYHNDIEQNLAKTAHFEVYH